MALTAEALRNLANIVLVIGLALAALGTFGVNFFRARIEKQRELRQADKEVQQTAREHELSQKLQSLLEGNQALQERLTPFEKLARERYPNSASEDALRRLQVDIGELDARAKALEERAAPRTVTPSQQQAFLKLMVPQAKATVAIQCIAGDDESCNFAKELGRLFSSAGFPTQVSDAVLFGPTAGPPVGVYMVLDREAVPSCAPTLQETFRQMGLTVETYPGGSPGTIAITVGVKPKHG